MSDLFLALSARVLVNLESLNMAGSIGNVTKHRRAPVVVYTSSGFKLLQVPVISGMSLAYSYQYLLAKVAKDNNLPVANMSSLGYFLKYSDDKIIKNYYKDIGELPGDLCDAEKTLVEKDVIADVGGFLYTDGGIKRTSRFSFSYMMPAMDALKSGAVGLTPQIHVRFSPEAKQGEQALVYNENGSALYTLSFILDASGISKLDMCRALGKSNIDLGTEVRKKRFDAAVTALISMIGNGLMGAKRSRNLPHYEVQS
ncbi:MAG: DevR family CRISPR-associated autoregulator, partial [Sulfolobus sp.]|nr:DevR family CRISPR-associated autoregulator [Sulfolobus sp.]